MKKSEAPTVCRRVMMPNTPSMLQPFGHAYSVSLKLHVMQTPWGNLKDSHIGFEQAPDFRSAVSHLLLEQQLFLCQSYWAPNLSSTH
jgi:hypothetical protein